MPQITPAEAFRAGYFWYRYMREHHPELLRAFRAAQPVAMEGGPMTASWVSSGVGDTGYGQYTYDVYNVDGEEVMVHLVPGEILPEPRPGETEVYIIWEGALDFEGGLKEAAEQYPELAAAGAFD